MEIRSRYTADVIFTVPGVDLRGADLSGANLSGAYLREADLREADLSGAYLSGADLSGADLSGANLSEAYLRGANLSEAYLRGANLSEAYLSGANLSGADLRGANLSGANLSGADLGGANLSGANLSGAKGLPEAPVVPDLDAKMLAAVSAPGALDMNEWHTCETTHCRAGWAVTLAGKAGKELERATSTSLAAMLIYRASTGRDECPDFYATNEEAMADIERCAELAKGTK